jgi:hypothetical protein
MVFGQEAAIIFFLAMFCQNLLGAYKIPGACVASGTAYLF